MTSLHRRLPERFVLLNGCFNFRNLRPGWPLNCSARRGRRSPTATAGLTAKALFGPARKAPAGAGPADRLAAFLGAV
jgi:hypothetical protein